jgi:two-component system chemotaxis response regulator CheY
MRILIAEDSQAQAVDLRRRLKSLGYEVVVTSNGLDAWNHLQARPESLVITDWMMPEMNGLDLCRKIRCQSGSPYTYLILLTAKNHRHERLQGLNAGADDFLAKPVDTCELEIALKTARRIISAHEALHSRARELERANQELARIAMLDELTGLKNRRGLRDALADAIRQAREDNLPLSLVRLELIPSEKVQSPLEPTYHGELPASVAELLLAESRECDIAARVSELGFALLLPGVSEERALATAELLRVVITELLHDESGPRLLVGVASMVAGDALMSEDEFLRQSEAALMAGPAHESVQHNGSGR